MALIRLHKTHTAKVKGKQMKLVTCDACGEQYGYVMHRKASANSMTFIFMSSAKN
jgi:hypothetical protein